MASANEQNDSTFIVNHLDPDRKRIAARFLASWLTLPASESHRIADASSVGHDIRRSKEHEYT